MSGGENYARDWDHYWRSTHIADASVGCCVNNPALRRFWAGLFARWLPAGNHCRFLDLASGDGAVTRFALDASHPPASLWAMDYSPSALLELRKHSPQSLCVAADAAAAPFADGCFDLVCSQFGIEYAGSEAILAARRLVAPGGALALVVHLQGSTIYKESRQTLKALASIQRSDLMPAARRAFEAGFAVNRGGDNLAAFKAAERDLTAAMRNLQQILARMGNDVATGLPRQIYVDLTEMYGNMAAYDPDDIYGWVDRMMLEIDAFQRRMTSMTGAALDPKTLRSLVTRAAAGGLKPRINQALSLDGSAKPGAWTLLLERT